MSNYLNEDSHAASGPRPLGLNQPVEGHAGVLPEGAVSPSRDLTAEDVRAILERISGGFYESNAVRIETATRILHEMGSVTSR